MVRRTLLVVTMLALAGVTTLAQTPTEFKGHTGYVFSVALSPDGKWLATGSFDGIIDLWPGNLEEWKQLACRIVNRNLTQDEWSRYLGDNEPYRKTCE